METDKKKCGDSRDIFLKNPGKSCLDVTSVTSKRRRRSKDSSDGSSSSSHSSSSHSSPSPKKGRRSESSEERSNKRNKPKRSLSSSSSGDSVDGKVFLKKSKALSSRNVRNFRKRSSSRSQSRSPSRGKGFDLASKRSSDLEKKTSYSSERELEKSFGSRKEKKVTSEDKFTKNSQKVYNRNSQEKSPVNADTRNSKERSCSADSRHEKSNVIRKNKDKLPNSDQESKVCNRVEPNEKDKNKECKVVKARRSRTRSKSRDGRNRRPYKSRSRSKGKSYRSRRDDSPRKRSRSRDRYSYRSRVNPRKRQRSRSRENRRRSRSCSGSRDRTRHSYRRRSSSRDRYRRRRSISNSRSRSRSRLSSREKIKSDLVSTSASVGCLPLSTTTGAMTPQMALQQTMALMSAKAQALTGIALPKYYNPAAVNPLKYAEQVQKRKLLWQSKEKQEEQPSKSTVWDKLTFTQDDDGKMTAKFRKLMGIKADSVPEKPPDKEITAAVDESALKKQEELFRNLDQQYEMARMSTHTHRGVGLGYSSQAIFPPAPKQ